MSGEIENGLTNKDGVLYTVDNKTISQPTLLLIGKGVKQYIEQ